MTTSRIARIMIPLDGMEAADRAIAVAARIACRTGAQLHLVSVCRPVSASSAMLPGFVPYPTDLDAMARESLRSHLDARVEETITVYSVSTVSAILDGPESVADQLAAYARRHDIDLIVMRSHGRSAIGSFCFGSVGAALMERSHVPCLLLRDGNLHRSPSAPVRWGFARILVPLDGTPESEAGIEQAVALANRSATEITLLVVVPDRWVPAPGIGLAAPDTPELAAAKAYVEGLAHRLDVRGFRARGMALARPSVPAGIAECVEAQQSDLVSICSHHRSEGDRLIFGSVIDTLVHGTRVPVLARRTTRAEVVDLPDAACTVCLQTETAAFG